MAYKYQRIGQEILEQALSSGNGRLPSEQQICRRYKVSRTTAMRALNRLKQDSLVRREVGRGTFINPTAVKTRIRFLVPRMLELEEFAAAAAERFNAESSWAEILVHPVDTRDWYNPIVTIPGTKVILATHVGFLVQRDLLLRLDQRPFFDETARHISNEAIAWTTARTGDTACYALPLLLSPTVLAFNRAYAQELGLDADLGPRTWDELRVWARAARRLRRHRQQVWGCGFKRDNMPPISYYLSLAGGRNFIRVAGGKPMLDFQHGKEWMQFFRNMYTAGELVEYPVQEREPLIFGKALMSVGVGGWVYNQARRFKMRDPIGVCPIPTPRPGMPGFSILGKAELAIVRQEGGGHEGNRRQDKEQEAAWSFIRHLVTDEQIQRKLVETVGCLSINNRVRQEQQVSGKWSPLVRAMAMGRVRCDHPVQHPIMRVIYKYYYATVADGMNAARACECVEELCRVFVEMHEEL